MTNTEVLNEIKPIFQAIKPKYDVEKISLETTMAEIGVDSLSMLLLSLAVEERFKITFETGEPFAKVGQVCDYVVAHCSN